MRDQDWAIISKLHSVKNITKTADLMFMTQPTLTKRIQQIEEELGIVLVSRSSTGVVFTSEGEYMAQKAKEILHLFDDVAKNLERINNGEEGTLKLGVSDSFCRFSMPHLIKEYNKMHKDIRFDIIAARSHEVLRMVENHDVDAGFVRGECESSLEQIVVSTDQLHIVSRDPLSLSDLPQLPQIDFIKDPSIAREIERWWGGYFNTSPSVFMRLNYADTCLAMILEGLGYGIFPDIGYTKGEKTLFTIPLEHKDGAKFVHQTKLVYHHESMDNAIIKDFVRFIKAG